MFQSLPQGRFKLKVHREMRDLSLYQLTIAKGGPKMPQSNCAPLMFNIGPRKWSILIALRAAEVSGRPRSLLDFFLQVVPRSPTVKLVPLSGGVIVLTAQSVRIHVHRRPRRIFFCPDRDPSAPRR